MFQSVWVNALFAGMVSACSMPLGSLTTLVWTPKNRALAFLMAFGGGALLSALVIDLVGSAREKGHILEIELFQNLSLALETSPEFRERTEQILQQEKIRDYLQQLHGLSLTAIKDWVSLALTTLQEKRKIAPAVMISYKQNEFLQLARKMRRFPVFSYLTTAEPFGELSFVTAANHTVTAIAKTDVTLWTLRKQDFEEMLQQSPRLEESVKNFVEQPKLRDYLQTRQHFNSTKAAQWIQQALNSMDAGKLIPSATRINSIMAEHKEAPMAIWLGLLMDGIPEALTIGAHIVTNPISPSLMAGLLLSNYPEALSSSEGMKQQGFSIPRILGMWTSLMLITGILSAFGSLLFADVPESVISLLESMAAGAMLTVISETMLPEAYAKGGSIVGLSTLLRFLAIIIIKSYL